MKSFIDKEKWRGMSDSARLNYIIELLKDYDPELIAKFPEYVREAVDDYLTGNKVAEKVSNKPTSTFRVYPEGYIPDSDNIEAESQSEDVAESESNELKDTRTEWQIAKKPLTLSIYGLAIFSSLAYMTFQFMWFVLFPFMLGLAVVFLMLTLWAVIDANNYPGDTNRKIAGSAIALSVNNLAIVLVFGIGLLIGQTFVTNPMGAEERVEVQITLQKEDGEWKAEGSTADSLSPSSDAELPLPSSNGRSFREQ